MSLSDGELLERAREAAGRAYCPYSNFPVGAVVETDIGMFAGCNVENASYGLTVCAERVALWAAVAAGAKVIRCLAVACVGASAEASAGSRMPCGACRQVMAELMTADSRVLVEGVGEWRVADLLPSAFQLEARPFLQGR